MSIDCTTWASEAAVATEPDFRLLFQATRARNLALAPDLTIVAASDAYLSEIGVRREAILGRDVVDALRGVQAWSYVSELRAALCRVIAQKQAGVMPMQKLRFTRGPVAGGPGGERAWMGSCSPVFGDDGRIAYILHCLEPVTATSRFRA